MVSNMSIGFWIADPRRAEDHEVVISRAFGSNELRITVDGKPLVYGNGIVSEHETYPALMVAEILKQEGYADEDDAKDIKRSIRVWLALN